MQRPLKPACSHTSQRPSNTITDEARSLKPACWKLSMPPPSTSRLRPWKPGCSKNTMSPLGGEATGGRHAGPVAIVGVLLLGDGTAVLLRVRVLLALGVRACVVAVGHPVAVDVPGGTAVRVDVARRDALPRRASIIRVGHAVAVGVG